VAAVPFLKMLNRPNATTPETFLTHLVDGAAKPVGGDTEGTVRWAPKAQRQRSRGLSSSSSDRIRSKGGRR
jgi:hypothetical protein